MIKELNNIIDQNHKKVHNKNPFNTFDFETCKYPILCTKRDLILKKFGYFYYKDYFNDKRFIKMKNYFLYTNNPENENNNYNGFQKSMKNNYPSIIKNFSNNSLYYPRMFYRPYTKFFESKYFSISHSYFKNQINDIKNNYKIFNLKYGHGLLNQPNFNLYRLSNNLNDDYSSIMDESINSSFSNGSQDKINNSYASNEDFHQNLKLYDNLLTNKNLGKSVHMSNKNLPVTNFEIKEDNNSKKNVRSKFHKKTTKQKLTINPNDNNEFSNFNSTKNIKKNLLFECELICPKNTNHGILFLNKNFLIYQVDTKFNIKKYETDEKYLVSSSNIDLEQEEKQIIIKYNQIYQILFRKFLFFNQAFEIFLSNGKSYFFNLYNEEIRNNFIKKIKEIIKKKMKNVK